MYYCVFYKPSFFRNLSLRKSANNIKSKDHYKITYKQALKIILSWTFQKCYINLIPEKIFNSSNYYLISEKVWYRSFKWLSEIQVWKNVDMLKILNFLQTLQIYQRMISVYLRGTLQRCITFIKFYNFTSKEISDTVIPYREILPADNLNTSYEFKLLLRGSQDGFTPSKLNLIVKALLVIVLYILSTCWWY